MNGAEKTDLAALATSESGRPPSSGFYYGRARFVVALRTAALVTTVSCGPELKQFKPPTIKGTRPGHGCAA